MFPNLEGPIISKSINIKFTFSKPQSLFRTTSISFSKKNIPGQIEYPNTHTHTHTHTHLLIDYKTKTIRLKAFIAIQTHHLFFSKATIISTKKPIDGINITKTKISPKTVNINTSSTLTNSNPKPSE